MNAAVGASSSPPKALNSRKTLLPYVTASQFGALSRHKPDFYRTNSSLYRDAAHAGKA
jgi:hypothetical protein